MFRSRLTARLSALALILPIAGSPLGVAVANAAPPQGDKRKDLMDQLGLPKKPAKPPADDDDDSGDADPDDDADASPDDPDPDGPDASTGGSGGGSKRQVTYTGKIRKQLAKDCGSCHDVGQSAGGTRFVITGALDADYRAAKRLVSTKKPKSSVLLTKANGKGHGGGTNYASGSSGYRTLLEWIEGGAPKGGGSSTAPTPAPKPDPKPDPKPKTAKPKTAKPKTPKSGTQPGPTDAGTPEPSWVDPSIHASPEPIVYAPVSHEILQARCGSCHADGAFAAAKFGLSGEPERDYELARAYVQLDDPSASPLLSKARGESHGGGATLTTDEDDYRALLSWIEAGALGPGASAAGEPSAAGPEPSAGSEPEPEVDVTSGASRHAAEPGARLGDGTPVPESTGSRLPYSLPYHLRINGRFDLSYERRDYKNQPFGPGRNALQSYHHFLFLSRSGADDPFGFNVELVTQQFYEFNARFVTKDGRAKFLIKAGKILVPFGDEPLYHSSYGGKTGFDQQLLPTVWSQPGLAVNAHIQAGPVSISNDTYAVQGYALRAPDGVLNLQGDFSTLDNFRFGVGDRLGLSWAPLTAWYSIQVNPLGDDRLLLMQAFDFEFWRLQDVPVLQDLVVGFGAMRADVSGGGRGQDYYHFGSYGKLRYYPVDWLYIQYRWGLKTFDNRRGVYYDDTRADERDVSSHNLSIGATYKGFFAALQLFWNLEKANEQDDDFLRFTLGYAF